MEYRKVFAIILVILLIFAVLFFVYQTQWTKYISNNYLPKIYLAEYNENNLRIAAHTTIVKNIMHYDVMYKGNQNIIAYLNINGKRITNLKFVENKHHNLFRSVNKIKLPNDTINEIKLEFNDVNIAMEKFHQFDDHRKIVESKV